MKTHKVIDIWNANVSAFEGTYDECVTFGKDILISGYEIQPIDPSTGSDLNDLINDINTK